MTALSDITLLRPFWLLALPLVGAAFWLLVRRRAEIGDWSRVVEPEMMAALRAMGHVEDGRLSTGAIWSLATVAVIVLALAGPAVERRDAVTFRNLDGVVFVLDSSPSMTASPDWTQIQSLGRFAIVSLGTRPAGLVVYAGDAYVATDLTADKRQLGQTFSLIGPETVPDAGSRPWLALDLAARILREADVLAGDVILLTDGANLGPEAMTAAAAIAGQGARLSVVTSDPDDSAVATVAATGGGRTFGLGDTEALIAFLKDDGRTRLERQDWPLLFWSDMGRYILVLALLPALFLLRRRA